MDNARIVETIRRTGQLSPTDPVYTDYEILNEATQALRDRFAAPIMLCRQGYWLKEAVTTTNGVDASYRIPANTIVQGLEKVEIADAGSSNYRNLLVLTQTQATSFMNVAKGKPTHFTLEADHVRLWPAPDGAYNLRMVFYLQPPWLNSILVDPIFYVVSTTEDSIELGSDPSAYFQVGNGFYIQHTNGSYEIPCFDGMIVGITGNTIYAPGYSGRSQIQAGDHFTYRDTSNFPMLPEELHRPLCDYVAGEIWTSKGDKEKATALLQKSSAGINRFVEMAVSRVKTRPFTWKRTNSYLRKAVG